VPSCAVIQLNQKRKFQVSRIDPGEPLDKDIYALSPEELHDVPKLPGSRRRAARAGRRPRVLATRRRVHHRLGGDLGQLQTRARSGRGPLASRPYEFFPLLRHLDAAAATRSAQRAERGLGRLRRSRAAPERCRGHALVATRRARSRAPTAQRAASERCRGRGVRGRSF